MLHLIRAAAHPYTAPLSCVGKEVGEAGLVSNSSQEQLDATPELDYLTHIVIRLYENKRCLRCTPRYVYVVVVLASCSVQLKAIIVNGCCQLFRHTSQF